MEEVGLLPKEVSSRRGSGMVGNHPTVDILPQSCDDCNV